MSDRRRANGPIGGTVPASFTSVPGDSLHPVRARDPGAIRKICIVPSASGSAYLELEQTVSHKKQSANLVQTAPTLKISCTVHGPKPVARSAPFSTNLLLTTHVKFAPFATRIRRGYVRDTTERDLAVHVETALRSVILAERWPKSGLDIVLTILEGDERLSAPSALNSTFGPDSLGLMSMLSGCITAASLALADAGIDCVDLVAGGVAALVPARDGNDQKSQQPDYTVVQDPVSSEHGDAVAACVVGYLRSRDELAHVWMLCGSATGLASDAATSNLLLDGAAQAAVSAQRVVVSTLEGR